MKLTELKSPYRELAEMRHEKQPYLEYVIDFLKTNDLRNAFDWELTSEGSEFWLYVQLGELPTIPQSSLDELSEWQKGKEPKYDVTLIADKPKAGVQFGIAATADFLENTWTFEMPENFSVSAGEFAIVPKAEYEALLTELNKVK